MWMIVGLGNPGSQYEQTRHNVGFMIVDELLGRAGAGTTKAKFGAEVAEGKLGPERVLFCKPMQFMNVSGQPTVQVATFWKVTPAQTVVIYDDLDLPFGRLKLGAGGGHGGHNGMRSLIAAIGADFQRVRVGIGRPTGPQDPADYVLSPFSKAEQKDLPTVIADACDATEAIVRQGLTAAMNRYNVKDTKKDKKQKPTTTPQ